MHAATRDEPVWQSSRPPAFVVEDDGLMLRLLSDVASSVGLRPLPFTRLSTVRRALQQRVPKVIVLDDDLPDGRGADFARELRADPRTRHVKVIVCTSAGPARRRQIAEHVTPVIAKPFAVSEVEGALREVTSS